VLVGFAPKDAYNDSWRALKGAAAVKSNLTHDLSRRGFLGASAAGVAAGLAPSCANGFAAAGNLHLGTFRFDVTPPMGHSLCGGWIKPVVGVDDPLEAIGYVLLGAGLIDPMLKTVAMYNQHQKLVACHDYACHPMSYYGDGRVSSDFCGLARKQRQQQEPECTHLYFNGCGGNIGAGKYNDGSKEMRGVLTQRILRGMVASEQELDPQAIESIGWETHDILPPADARFDEEALMRQISDSNQRVVSRNRPSFTLAWIRRAGAKLPITLSSLHVNDVSLLHLPSECFVEYQLRAQASAPNRFVACAAYGDGGPWYIPTADAYPQGGYAVGVAWCDPAIDQILSGGINELLARSS
jgi:hypothetical protein